MKLIKYIGKRPNKKGTKSRSWGLYYCNFCKKEVEKEMSAGKRIKSCGCAHAMLCGLIRKTHGEYQTRLYHIWTGMKGRCLNLKDKNYKNYGGRGISICTEWKNSYIAFRNWALSHKYKDVLIIDRINNDGNYIPSNCRWITRTESRKNQRNTKLDWKKVREIRKKYATGNYGRGEFTQQYNVCRDTINSVIKYRYWKEANML